MGWGIRIDHTPDLDRTDQWVGTYDKRRSCVARSPQTITRETCIDHTGRATSESDVLSNQGTQQGTTLKEKKAAPCRSKVQMVQTTQSHCCGKLAQLMRIRENNLCHLYSSYLICPPCRIFER